MGLKRAARPRVIVLVIRLGPKLTGSDTLRHMLLLWCFGLRFDLVFGPLELQLNFRVQCFCLHFIDSLRGEDSAKIYHITWLRMMVAIFMESIQIYRNL